MTNEIKNRIDQIRNGEVPSGYKQTKFGVMCSEWSEDKLSDLYYMSSGNTPSRGESSNFQGDVPWLSSGELKPKFIDNTKEKITEEVAKKCNLKKYAQGTFVSAIYGLEADGVRSTCSLLAVPSTISQACMAFESKGEVSNLYLYYWYKHCGEIIGIRYAQGTKQQNLSTDIFGSLRMNHPHNCEQQKIAEILAIQDEVIDKKERCIFYIKNRNKGLVQNLIFGKVRVREAIGDWSKIKFSDILLEMTKRNKKLENENVLSVSNKAGFVSQTDHFSKNIASKDLSNYKIVSKNYIAYNPSRINVGSIALCENDEVGVVSPMYVVMKCNNKANIRFLMYYFKTKDFNTRMKSYISGSVRDSLSFKDLSCMAISLPPIEEQNAIAEILSTADREIELLEQDLAQEKLKKKALMQLLLTGIVRVV